MELLKIERNVLMNKQEYIYFENPEFCKKMVAKYGED